MKLNRLEGDLPDLSLNTFCLSSFLVRLDLLLLLRTFRTFDLVVFLPFVPVPRFRTDFRRTGLLDFRLLPVFRLSTFADFLTRFLEDFLTFAFLCLDFVALFLTLVFLVVRFAPLVTRLLPFGFFVAFRLVGVDSSPVSFA